MDALLGQRHELENQTTYFASPEELNDPMEGFRDIVWSGDKIAWTNLFKHYASYLNYHLLMFRILGKSVELNIDSNPILVSLAQPLIPLEKKLFDEAWHKFLNVSNMQEVIKALANTKRKIRYKEIVVYLKTVHFTFLDQIQKSYIVHGLMSESETPHKPEDLPDVTWLIERILNFIQETEENEFDSLDNILSFSEEASNNLMLKLEHDIRKLFKRIPRRYIVPILNELALSDFTQAYVDNLKNLPFPKWWTACFTKSYDNLSVWAKYADGHKGACLIFKDNLNWKSVKYRITGFHKVSYQNKPTELDFFRSIGAGTVAEIMKTWYTDKDGNRSECASHIGDESEGAAWRKDYWDNFFRIITTKNRDWEYEQEYRVILYDIVRGVVEKEDHILTYDFNSLKGVIFGMRTSTEDKMKIIDIIKSKCGENNRTDFKFFQADYSPENGDICKYEI